ncbi:hypothetical protein OG423_05940 [Micromonospora zamorensis]|uniref:hypothetical protein n=1 Tax=Micromonospora zamorensis TaxID=709883 RepID=UPI00352A9DA9|nr:hypothetical protein OG423_05940 [Micromonospora zamorensis]
MTADGRRGFDPPSVRDIDVVFLDPADLARDNDDRAAAGLRATWPDPLWEATPAGEAGSPT